MARCPVRRNVHANMHGQSTSVALCTCPAALFASNVCLLPSACMCIQKFSYIQMFSYIQKFSYIQMISFDTVAQSGVPEDDISGGKGNVGLRITVISGCDLPQASTQLLGSVDGYCEVGRGSAFSLGRCTRNGSVFGC